MDHYRSFAKYVLNWLYLHPVYFIAFIAMLSNVYLIYDYDVVNRSSIEMLWALNIEQDMGSSPLSQLIYLTAKISGLSYVSAGHFLMIFTYCAIAILMLLISRLLEYSLLSQWALIFLLLSHPSFNDFRSYIIVEPIFWFLWLLAIYFMLMLYKSKTIWCIFIWLGILVLATKFNVAAWFWLLLFPFGALLWKPWRRKSVAYALFGYAVIVLVLLFLPFYEGISPFEWLKKSILENPAPLSSALRLDDNNWVKEGDALMSGVFVVSGATSLIVMRASIGLSVACLFLAVYAILKKQHHVIKRDYLRVIFSAIVFDLMITVILLLLSADSKSVLSFSVCFLLLLFSALGLSHIFKKIYLGKYSRLQMLVIVWCLVAYFASGFIIFGPRQGYLKEAGLNFYESKSQTQIYSNDSYFLFYAGKNPSSVVSLRSVINFSKIKSFYYAHAQSRKSKIPDVLKAKKVIKKFSNSRGDRLLIYWFDLEFDHDKQNNQDY